MSRAALRTPADLIHIGKPHPMNGIAGFIAKKLRGKRGIKLWQDVDDIEAEINRFGAGWQKKGVDLFERWLPAHMDGVTTHTSINRERLLGYGVPAERLHHLSNGIDRTRFAPPDPQQVSALRHKLGLEG